MIDFTTCKIIPGRAYNGANGNKIAVNYNGTVYMLKFPPSAEGKPTELSYTNGCISEHIASSVFNLIGVQAHETMLGTYQVRGKEKLVCACKDFTFDNKRFFDFCSIKNTVLDTDSNGTGTELSDVLEAIDKQYYIDPITLREHFWDMFIIDALLGNFDRHNGNWGFLYDESTEHTSIAPVYDCGSCLLPQADEGILRQVLSSKPALHARVFQYPTSALKINGRKINYFEFIVNGDNPDCNAALSRICPRIDINHIDSFINQVECISELQKDFYKSYIHARFDLILMPAYKDLL